MTAIVVVAMGLGVVVSAQRGGGRGGRGQQQAPSPRPVFRAAANFVTLDVVVTDKDDRPVTDLRQEEFRIIENKVPQTIEDFAFVTIPGTYRPIDLDAPRPPAADVASNAMSPNASRALAIVVDDTTLRVESAVIITRSLRGLLEGLSPDDQVAFTYVRRSDLGHDFTNDREQLVQSVNKLRDAVGLPALGRYPIRDLFIVLNNAIDSLSVARQARKAIVLVNTHGCDPSHRDTGDMCRAVIDHALRAGVPIYGLNPLGLMDAMSTYGAGAFEDPDGRAGLEAEIENANHSLKILAQNTGGRAFVRSNLQAAVQEVMSDNGNFYLLGYYPNPTPNDGKFHDVSVSVTRPGLRVRSRKGYMATGGKTERTTPVREMTRILGEGLPDPRLPVRAFVAPLSTAVRISLAGSRGGMGGGMVEQQVPGIKRGTASVKGTATVVTIELQYPVPDGGFSGDFRDNWRVGILALDTEGKIKASFQRTLTFDGTWKASARGTFILNEVVNLPHNTANVRVGVTSQALDRSGTVHVPTKVQDFTKKDLQLSPLIIGVSGEATAVDAVLGLDRIRGLVPFQPSTTRTFSATQTLRVYTKAWWKSDAERVAGDLRIVGAGSAMPAQALDITGARQPNGQRRAEIDRTLPLADLAPGAYVIRLTMQAGNKGSVTREIPFEIR